MENTKGKKKHSMCEDIEDLVVGDVLVWDNTSGATDCVVTKCQPALESDTYTIPAHKTMDAKAVAKSNQKYHCKCNRHGKEGDPKLIVR
jgi:hypothetical protein